VSTPLPKNRAAFTLAEAALATGGQVRRGDLRTAPASVGVSTDSRSVAPGEAFVALVGERFDGHDHVAAAVGRGASLVVVSRDVSVPGDAAILRVPDTLRALGALAQAHRRRWAARPAGGPRRVVAVTGSAGKTTTRHAAAVVLSALGWSVHASAGNLNNAVGVPHVLFGLEPRHDVAVVEVGTSSPGEIAHAAEIADPDVAVLTLVSEAHTEGVGTLLDLLREKSDLFAAVHPHGTVVANGDDALARAALVRARARRQLTYGGSEDAEVRLLARTPRGLAGSDLTIEIGGAPPRRARFEATVPILGVAGASAALAATACALALDPDAAGRTNDIARAIASLRPPETGRLSARETEAGGVVIDDAYNANPASTLASIDAAREVAVTRAARLVLVLGAMRELGPRSAELHAEVGRAAAASGAGLLIVVGPEAEPLAAAAEARGAAVVRAADAAQAERAAHDAVRPGDVVLVKASNSLGLMSVAARLRGGQADG
jgi:UDP-N-acetylmuramoyl-tripeptide--D-alanyl-D-alanine ligase